MTEEVQDKEGEAQAQSAEEQEQPEATVLNPVPEDGVKRRWYALHAHSGQESTVKEHILTNAALEGIAHLVVNILVPMEQVAEMRSGEKKVSKRKFFPGYVLAQLPEHPEQHAELWHLIMDTPGVSGFIGSRKNPVPLEDSEVNAIVEVMQGERERPKPSISFKVGERVKIIEGPFANFLGKIDEINLDRGTMKVLVEIFERLTSIEVEHWQVEQI